MWWRMKEMQLMWSTHVWMWCIHRLAIFSFVSVSFIEGKRDRKLEYWAVAGYLFLTAWFCKIHIKLILASCSMQPTRWRIHISLLLRTNQYGCSSYFGALSVFHNLLQKLKYRQRNKGEQDSEKRSICNTINALFFFFRSCWNITITLALCD